MAISGLSFNKAKGLLAQLHKCLINYSLSFLALVRFLPLCSPPSFSLQINPLQWKEFPFLFFSRQGSIIDEDKFLQALIRSTGNEYLLESVAFRKGHIEYLLNIQSSVQRVSLMVTLKVLMEILLADTVNGNRPIQWGLERTKKRLQNSRYADVEHVATSYEGLGPVEFFFMFFNVVK